MNPRLSIGHLTLGTFAIWILLVGSPHVARAQAPGGKPPNIVVIMGDDIGWFDKKVASHQAQ